MRTLGAVLAGGRSSRFGRDKALAQWRGTALIDHVVAALAGEVDAVAICGRHHRGLPALGDRPASDLGPLAAINAALHHGAEHGFDRVLTVPCDVPAIAPGLLRLLLDRRDAAVVAAMPVIGIWPVALADALDAHLARGGDRSIRGWAAAAGAASLDLPPGWRPRNINQASDLAALALESG